VELGGWLARRSSRARAARPAAISQRVCAAAAAMRSDICAAQRPPHLAQPSLQISAMLSGT